MNTDSRLRDYMIDLLGRPGTIEILLALDDHPATVIELQSAGLPDVSRVLRASAATGLVSRYPVCGTWDADLPSADSISLTMAGREIVETLRKINAWGLRRMQPAELAPARTI